MHAQPPRTLKRLLKQYGQELIDDPRRTEALLRDHCGQHTREIFVLVNAQKQRVPNELLAAPAWMPRQATYTRLSRLLQTKLALTEDAADWAVAAWAAALDLEALPKGETWSWLPGQGRAPKPTGKRKSRGKKRQNSPSSVQYPKSTTRSATRQTKGEEKSESLEVAPRSELGWTFPKLEISDLRQLITRRVVWTNLLPWLALLAATVFLLTVVYWTSANRPQIEATEQPSSGETAVVEQTGANPANPNLALTPIQTNVTPLPELPAPAREYLASVMPLPTWANVNVTEPLLIRQQPSTNAPWLNVLQDNQPVKVIGFSEDSRWSQIVSPFEGWVSNDFLTFMNQEGTLAFHLNVQRRAAQNYAVTVYAEPDALAASTATLQPGAEVIVAAVMGEPVTWYQIADPAIGWVAANDLVPSSY